MAAPSLEEQRRALHSRVEVDMSLRPPTQGEAEMLDILRLEARALAHSWIDLCPPSRELSLALSELDSAVRWAIAAVIRQPRGTDVAS